MPTDWINALIGGILIGLAVSLMLYWNGRIAGISGILDGAMKNSEKGDNSWRWMFLLGLAVGGIILKLLKPDVFSSDLGTPLWTVIAAGLFVGFGTLMGGGCTSGHGVCGISRLSVRSITATLIFIATGVLTVFVTKHFGVMP